MPSDLPAENSAHASTLVLERAACPQCASLESEPVCQSQDFLYGVPGTFAVCRCSKCSLWFQNPRPALLSLAQIYPDTYVPYEGGAASRRTTGIARKVLRAFNPIRRELARSRLLPKWIVDGRVLELGCASGAFLAELREQSWRDLIGIEFSAAAAEKARALGFDVRCGRLEDELQSFPAGHFDVVIASMVLEHLHEPIRAMHEVARVLKPGGQFLFSTIVRDSVDARLYGRYWAGFDLPRHMVYFTRDELVNALQPQFDAIEHTYQLAWIDFVRSSTWRRKAGERHLLDRAVLAVGNSIAGQLFGVALARLGLPSRISFRCNRVAASE